MVKEFIISPKQVLREYNAGFDSGTWQKKDSNNPLIQENINVKVPSGLKSEFPLVKAYWQGYYDAWQGWHRNPNYTMDSKPPWPK